MAKYSLQKQIFGLSLFFMLIPLVLFSAFNISTSIRKVEENYRSSLIFGMKKIGSVMEMVYEDVDQVSLFALVDPKINHFLKEQFRGETAYETSPMDRRSWRSRFPTSSSMPTGTVPSPYSGII